MKYKKTDDGSIEDETGKVIYFSLERFEADIASGNCCFICGAPKDSKPFNDEHILPNWLLRKFGLHSRTITLPNLSRFKYGQYVIPCCKDCNSEMGDKIEHPIQSIIDQGYSAVANHVSSQGLHLFFVWLSLIFLKTHFKDSSLRLNQTRGSGDDRTIAHAYDYAFLHHIHCVARSFYTDAQMEPGAIGSFFVLPAKQSENYESFDFADLYPSRSILLRINDIAFVAVLDDACGALNLFFDDFKKITGPLSPLQLRELLAHLSYINLYLKERPTLGSRFDPLSGEYTITAKNPEHVTLVDENERKDVSELIYGLCSPILKGHPRYEEIEPLLKQGRWHFLFDGEGKFQTDSMEMAPVKD